MEGILVYGRPNLPDNFRELTTEDWQKSLYQHVLCCNDAHGFLYHYNPL